MPLVARYPQLTIHTFIRLVQFAFCHELECRDAENRLYTLQKEAASELHIAIPIQLLPALQTSLPGFTLILLGGSEFDGIQHVLVMRRGAVRYGPT